MKKLILLFAISLLLPSIQAKQPPIDVKNTDGCRIIMGWENTYKQDILKWIKVNDYIWGLELRPNVPYNEIVARYNEGWNIVLHQLSHPESVKRYYIDKGREVPNIESTFEKFAKACSYDTTRLFWQNLLEDDSNGVCFSRELMAAKSNKTITHEEAYKLMGNYIQRAINTIPYSKGYEKWAVAGYASSAHILAKQKEVNLISIERANDDVDDLQTGIAFFRGAGKQYNKKWGIDLSLWWGAISGCIQELPTLYHKRHLYLSWYSGAEHLRIEGSDLLLKENNERTELAKCLDEFGSFIKTHKRGKVITKVAVILPCNHGWITSPYWRNQRSVWNYAKIPYRRGQKSIDGFFSMAFPGSNFYMDPFAFGKFKTENPPASPFALSCVSYRYAHNSSDIFMEEYPIPFGKYDSRDDAKVELTNKHLETSSHRPMGISKWGDIIDVFTDEASEKVLSNYEIIILLDQINIDNTYSKKLENLAKKGCKIICSVGAITPSNSELCGIDITPELAVGYSWVDKDGKTTEEPYRYTPAKLIGNTKAIIITDNNTPLVTVKHYKKGEIITCLVPWFEGVNSDLSKVAEKIFTQYISTTAPIELIGNPIEYIITKDGKHINIVLSNNSNTFWKGEVKLKERYKIREYKELLTNSSINIFNTNKIKGIKIPAYDIRIIRIEENI